MHPSIAYEEGLHAQAQGVPRGACPNDDSNNERKDWLAGWDAAADLDEHTEVAGDP